MYKIINNEIYENNKPTGVKAIYNKIEIWEKYGWSPDIGRRNFNSIQHLIYKKTNNKYSNRIKVLTPIQLTRILNYFGMY